MRENPLKSSEKVTVDIELFMSGPCQCAWPCGGRASSASCLKNGGKGARRNGRKIGHKTHLVSGLALRLPLIIKSF